MAEVGDAESRLEELILSWQRSDGVTLVGEQRSTDDTLSLTLPTGLPEGTCTVTLIAADPLAASGEDTVSFDVRALPPATGDTGNDTGDTGDSGDTGGSGGGDTGDTGPTAPEADVDTTGCEGLRRGHGEHGRRDDAHHRGVRPRPRGADPGQRHPMGRRQRCRVHRRGALRADLDPAGVVRHRGRRGRP